MLLKVSIYVFYIAKIRHIEGVHDGIHIKDRGIISTHDGDFTK